MSISRRLIWVSFVLFGIVGCVLTCDELHSQEPLEASQYEKLEAVARTFGYVRYFHPSDQASLVNWDRFAIFCANQTLNSSSDQTVDELLQSLFDPIVVGFEVYRGEAKPQPETADVPASEILAWQHYGVEMGTSRVNIYKSGRTNRARKLATGGFFNLIQNVDVSELKDCEIRFRFKAKTEHPDCRLQGWLRVDRESGKRGLFDNMQDRPVNDQEWKEHEISGTVDNDAEGLVFGIMYFGQGAAFVDDVRFEVKKDGDWENVEIKNGDFEDHESRPRGWSRKGSGFSAVVQSDDVTSGETALRIERRQSQTTRAVLKIYPKLGEVVDSEVASDLRIRMPLSLLKDVTYKSGDDKETDEFLKAISKTDLDADHNIQATANVIIAWNIFQHFYPYFEQVECDWDAVLKTCLERAAKSQSRETTTTILKWLVAQLDDGHGNLMDPTEYQNRKFVPVAFDWIEDELVVVATETEDLKTGDIVTHVNGVASKEYLEQEEELISGSPQWKRYRSTNNLSAGKSDSKLSLKVKGNEDDGEREVVLTYSSAQAATPKKRDTVELVIDADDPEDDIYYVDLGRATPEDVRPKIKDFAKAKGIIFDLRGYPKGTQFLFQHMTDEHMQSAKWQIPQQIRPDRVGMKEIETTGRWEMPPMKPRFQGTSVFITNQSAISYAESCMAIVAHYQLGEIIGSPTAGANGNINPFNLPGGYYVSWTGMRVMNHDDSQHHVYGVKPTIPLEPTIQGIRDGRDELFEKAMEVINDQ